MAETNGNYTFYPKFQEFVTLYRGVIRVWIGDGETTGTAGMLYAEYQDNVIQQLGYVSDYEQARVYFEELGVDLTYEQWVALLCATPQNARDAESWAVGKINGQDVSSTDKTYHNNSKYYKEQSGVWATGDGSGLGSPTNNSKYWAEQSKGFTNGKDLNGQAMPARSQDNAEYFKEETRKWVGSGEAHASDTDNAIYYKNQAKLWANNGVQGDSPGAQNNARYWAEQAKSYSDGKDLSDTTDVRPTDNSEYYKNQSKLWANGGTEGETPSATNNSKYHSEQSHEERLQSESWAKGTREGSPDTIRPSASTDNAKAYSEASHEENLQSESWAKGTRNSSPDSVRPNAATDNSKYYSEVSHDENLQSESWAKGTRNGTPDTVRQDAATDNAFYYSEQSKGWATGEGSHVDESAKKYAIDSQNSADNSANSAAASLASEHAAQDAQIAAETAQGLSEDAQHASEAAKRLAQQAQANAESEADDAEAWANGKRNGAPVDQDDPAYQNNSKYYSEQAASSATAADGVKQYVYESRTAAEEAQAAAEAAESSALSARDRAETAATNASNSASAAQTARTGAETAQGRAETARDRAEDALTKQPYVAQSNYTWRVWNAQTQSYIDTGVDARGVEGREGPQGRDGVVIDIGMASYSFTVNDDGDLILSYGGDTPPSLQIDNEGYLWYDY